MKITHQEATFTELKGFYTEKVVLPDGSETKIEFSFIYDVEFKRIKEVHQGFLKISELTSVTFSKVSTLWKTVMGRPYPEQWDISGIIYEHLDKVADAMQAVEVEVKFKNL